MSMKTKTISYHRSSENSRWLMSISEDGTITVTCNGETRTYKISEPMYKIEQEKDYPEYVRIDVQDPDFAYYLFKFEANYFFVGDRWREDNVHFGEFAMHVFGEECPEKEECIENGSHLNDCDDDGFCNACGHQ